VIFHHGLPNEVICYTVEENISNKCVSETIDYYG